MSTTDDILDQIDGAIADWSISPDAMRCGAPPGAGLTSSPRFPTPRADPESVRRFTMTISAAMALFAQKMNVVAVSVNRLVATNEGLRRALGLPPLPDEHHPAPLCIDGHAYRRRQRRRSR